MTAKTISPEAAEYLYDLEDDDGRGTGGYFRVTAQHVRTARWEEVFWLVVADAETGDTYGLEYREGLTEEQETTFPWETTDQPLPLVRLYPREVTTVVYGTKAPQ